MKNSLRFNVFKRDSFICQYCGKKAPDVILEVDHIIAKSKGGIDEIENLLTACFECNRGKGANGLTEIPSRVKKNVAEIKEKADQLREFYRYQKYIERKQKQDLKDVCDYWEQIWGESCLTKKGQTSIKTFLTDFSVAEIINAIDIASKIENDDQSFKYMCGILHSKRRERIERKGRDILNSKKKLT